MISNKTDVYEAEYRFRGGNDEWIWVRSKGKITERDITGKPIQMVGTQSDITLIKQWVKSLESTNNKLKESEENYRSLVGNVPGVVYRCSFDSDWTMHFISNAIVELSGYPAEDFIQNQTRSFASIIYPEDTAMVDQIIQKAVLVKEAYEIEYRIIHSDGKIRWIYERGYGTQYRDGKPKWLDGIIVDISERRQAESATKSAYQTQKVISDLLQISLKPLPLVEQLQHALSLILPLNSSMDQSSGAIFLLDPENNELILSAQEGLEKGLLKHCATVPAGRCLCGQALATNTVVFADRLDFRHETRCEMMRDHGHYCVPIHSDDQILGVLCLYLEAGTVRNELDISTLVTITSTLAGIIQRNRLDESLKQARITAEEATQAKSEFLAAMSHDIRTPMNAILGMGEVLKESPLDSNQKSALRVLTHAGENLLSLINDILDLSKIEAGQLHLEQTSFDFHELIDGVQQIFLQTAKSKGLDLELNITNNCQQWVLGDPQRLRQVLINLLGNAIKFTTVGKVSLLVESQSNETVRISVTDTGIGISAQQLEHIFDPFRQAEETTSRRFGGTGLGLSICSRLLKAMGGEIKVSSTTGKGSTFSFDIHLPESDKPQIRERLSRPVGEEVNVERRKLNLGVSKRILLVDDAEDNRMVISAFLRDTTCLIIEAVNGEEAVKAYKAQDIDLILMDVQMPVMGGIEATTKIRSWEKEQGRSSTPIVALTANAMREDIEKTKEAGCNLHLSKPIRKMRLLEIINDIDSIRGSLSTVSDMANNTSNN
ncbi:MAG: PAS domain-containing protein [Magnetococcales bacterium]|nr:PAS domain-containing protein [Magnetococcales bacterium]